MHLSALDRFYGKVLGDRGTRDWWKGAAWAIQSTWIQMLNLLHRSLSGLKWFWFQARREKTGRTWYLKDFGMFILAYSDSQLLLNSAEWRDGDGIGRWDCRREGYHVALIFLWKDQGLCFRDGDGCLDRQMWYEKRRPSGTQICECKVMDTRGFKFKTVQGQRFNMESAKINQSTEPGRAAFNGSTLFESGPRGHRNVGIPCGWDEDGGGFQRHGTTGYVICQIIHSYTYLRILFKIRMQ